MSSDNDTPYVAESDSIEHGSGVPIAVNGHVDGSGEQAAYTSQDDDDDDMPLVSSTLSARYE